MLIRSGPVKEREGIYNEIKMFPSLMNKYYELTWKCFQQQNAEKIVPLLHTVCECEPVFSLKQFTLDQKCASNAHGLTAKLRLLQAQI